MGKQTLMVVGGISNQLQMGFALSDGQHMSSRV